VKKPFLIIDYPRDIDISGKKPKTKVKPSLPYQGIARRHILEEEYFIVCA